jgi:2OG-Fe(II) oxygenase superfamily
VTVSAAVQSPSSFDLASVLRDRRWVRCETPFPHFRATDVFTSAFYASLEEELQGLLAKGLSPKRDRHRFARNMPNSDAYAWDFPPDIRGALSLFYSLEWHTLLSQLTGVSATGDVNGALHHHQLQSNDGSVHRDVGVGWFSDQRRPDGINPMDLGRCGYTHPNVSSPDIQPHQSVRAVTMIYYFGNPLWRAGDGGGTGLYRTGADPVSMPAAAIPPLNNSLVIFENTPDSWHSFLRNRRSVRNSAILWLHRSMAEAVDRWGDSAVSRW